MSITKSMCIITPPWPKIARIAKITKLTKLTKITKIIGRAGSNASLYTLTLMAALAVLTCIIPLVSYDVLGLGLTPAYIKLNYEPGLKRNLTFFVDGIPSALDAELYVDGDLAEYFELSAIGESAPGSGSMEFKAYLWLPDSMPDGRYVTRIGVRELGSGSGTMSALVAVQAPVIVDVGAEIRDEDGGPSDPEVSGLEEITTVPGALPGSPSGGEKRKGAGFYFLLYSVPVLALAGINMWLFMRLRKGS